MPDFALDDKVLTKGAAMMAMCAVETLDKKKEMQ